MAVTHPRVCVLVFSLTLAACLPACSGTSPADAPPATHRAEDKPAAPPAPPAGPKPAPPSPAAGKKEPTLLDAAAKHDGKTLAEWIAALADKDDLGRGEAAAAVAKYGPNAKDAVPALVRLLKNPDDLSFHSALTALAAIGPAAGAAVDPLTALLTHKAGTTRALAAYTLADIGPPAGKAVPAMIAAAADKKAGTDADRDSIRSAVETVGRHNIRAVFAAVRQEKLPGVSLEAVLDSLGPGDVQAVEGLAEELKRKDNEWVFHALGGLKRIGPKAAPALPAVRSLLEDKSELVRKAAAEAVAAIGTGGSAAPAARTPPARTLLAVLGAAARGPEVAALRRGLGADPVEDRAATSTELRWKGQGVSVVFDNTGRAGSVLVYNSGGVYGYAAYPGVLPFGLDLGDARAGVEKKLGPPDKVTDSSPASVYAVYEKLGLHVDYRPSAKDAPPTRVAMLVLHPAAKTAPEADPGPGPDGPAEAARPGADLPDDIRHVLTGAGFDIQRDTDWSRHLSGYVRFGSKAAADKYLRGDKFDKIEADKAAKDHRDAVRGKRFRVTGLKYQPIVRSDIETRGLVAQLELPMRVRGEKPFYEDAGACSGVLAALHPSELDARQTSFMTKDGTLRPCTPAEARLVEQNDGVLYHPERGSTTLILVFKDKLDVLKELAREAKDYSVELDFSDVQYARPPAWGYFRKDAYQKADWDCQKLWVDYLFDKDNPQPVYFPTAFLDTNPARIPEVVRARLDAVRVRDKDGKVVGGYRVK